MAEFSKISWTDATWNPWIGCSRVSEGCKNCYAENLMDRRYHRVEWGPGKPRVRTKTWNDPVKWNRWALEGVCRNCHGKGFTTEKVVVPGELEKQKIEIQCMECKNGKVDPYRVKVFCASLADWLDEEVPVQWREDVFDLVEACKSIDWLMLTKRIQNFATMVPTKWLGEPLKNVWVGVTAENQEWWDKRVPILAKTPASLRWVSYEPALGPIVIHENSGVNWIIAGGESEQTMDARRFDVEWTESVIEQCRKYGIVPFMKQKGTNAFYHGERLNCIDKAGTDPDEWPTTVRVREFPSSPALVMAS